MKEQLRAPLSKFFLSNNRKVCASGNCLLSSTWHCQDVAKDQGSSARSWAFFLASSYWAAALANKILLWSQLPELFFLIRLLEECSCSWGQSKKKYLKTFEKHVNPSFAQATRRQGMPGCEFVAESPLVSWWSQDLVNGDWQFTSLPPPASIVHGHKTQFWIPYPQNGLSDTLMFLEGCIIFCMLS